MPRYPSATPTLLIIGGAEDRVGRAALLRRFVRISGGRQARIVVIPTASSIQDEVVAAYSEVFGRFGVEHIDVVNPSSRRAAHDDDAVAALDAATGIFMSGGSQLRLSQVFPGTPLGDALHRAHARGAVVAGTSAGASIMSEFMISMGDEGITPVQRASQISAGLGLMKGVVVDQHFAQRARYGRLLSVVAASPSLLGIGIDEDTAIEVIDGTRFTVHGRGGVIVMDCRNVLTDAADARQGAPLLVSGAVIHTLPAGATFDLTTAEVVDFVEQHADVTARIATSTA